MKNKNLNIFQLLMLVFILTFINCINDSNKKIRKNISENIIKNLSNESKVNNTNRNNYRRLEYYYCNDWYEDDSLFEDLTINLDTLNLENELREKNLNAYSDLIINSMKEAAKILESFLKIQQYNDDELIDDEDIIDLGINDWDRDLIGNSAKTRGEKGNFFLIWGKFAKGEDEISGDNLAVAKIAFLDPACNYPSVGIIIFNPRFDYSKLTPKFLDFYFFHQFTHLLAFNKEVLENTTFFPNILEIDNEVSPNRYYIKSPKVVEFAQKYYNCKDTETPGEIIDKVEILRDSFGNYHWPSRYLLGEYMTELGYNEEIAISKFTLTLFEDLRYLRVKHAYTGGLMRFGKNKGCAFIKGNCFVDDSGDNDIKFENEFYYPQHDNINAENYEEPSCSSGRQSKTIYKLTKYSEGTIPTNFQHFGSSLFSGFKNADYCPVSQFFSSEKYSTGHCSDTNNVANEDRGESFSPTSFCALSSLIKKGKLNDEELPPSYLAICFEMICTAKSLTIKFDNDYFVCPRKGGKIDGVGYDGYLLCPDYNLICTGSTLCNNFTDCLENQSEEVESSYIYEEGYTIKTSQDSLNYLNDDNINYGSELTSEGPCPLNCAQCKKINDDKKLCVRCGPNYILKGSKDNDEVECIRSEDLGEGYYEDPSNHVYYPCISNCRECEDGTTCTTCVQNYKVKDNICVDKIENCQNYNSYEICTECKTNYGLVKDRSNNIDCQKISDLENTHYTKVEDGKTYYIKCSDTLNNCNFCESETSCTSCMNGFGTIDGNGVCVEIDDRYYYDSGLNTYKLCSYKNPGCNKCTNFGTNEINCIECDTANNYFLVYSELNKCILKSTIDNDRSIFYDSRTLKYFSCSDSRYHNVNNCLTCQNKNICDSCKTGYELANSNELCISFAEINQKKYYKNSDNKYYLCSEAMKGCELCEEAETCLKCNIAFDLDEFDKCIPTALAMTRYYLNSDTGRYESCSKIANCEECSSITDCTRCKSGYELENSGCTKIEKNESTNDKEKDVIVNNNDDNLKGITIGAIILGALGVVFSIVSFILIFFKKLLSKTDVNKNDPTESVNINKEEPKEVYVQQNKRTISNKLKNESE